MRAERGAALALWPGLPIAAVVALTAVLFSNALPPALGDYAEWTFHGVLLRNVLRGHADAAYLLKNYPVPNSMTTWVLGGLMLALPWTIAAKLWLVCEVVLGLAAAEMLRRAAGGPTRWVTPVLLAGAFLGTGFWAGFTNFLVGTALAMMFAAMLLRAVESGWLYGAVLLLAFFSHMVPFGFALLLFGLYAWQKRAWRLLWQTVPALAMSAWYFAGRALHGNADGQAGMVASVATFSTRFWIFKVNTFLKCWGFINPAMSEHDSVLLAAAGGAVFVMLLVLNVAIAVCVLGALAASADRALRNGDARDRFLWIGVVVFFAVACLMPGALAGISDPGGRMMQVAVWTGVAALRPMRRERWAGAVAGVCSVGLLAMNLYLLKTVAMRVPAPDTAGAGGRLPVAIRQFAHVYFADRYSDYGALERGDMDPAIYPTALFLMRR